MDFLASQSDTAIRRREGKAITDFPQTYTSSRITRSHYRLSPGLSARQPTRACTRREEYRRIDTIAAKKCAALQLVSAAAIHGSVEAE